MWQQQAVGSKWAAPNIQPPQCSTPLPATYGLSANHDRIGTQGAYSRSPLPSDPGGPAIPLHHVAHPANSRPQGHPAALERGYCMPAVQTQSLQGFSQAQQSSTTPNLAKGFSGSGSNSSGSNYTSYDVLDDW
uniref:Uncharacterized protein n=1 Tax=Eutreptiella gymnastica TaxID=73025 RepID=A0A7S1NRK8_9EUGL